MRFAVASDDGTTVASHTGRCQCFVIFDVENNTPKQVGVRINRFTAHALGQCDPGQVPANSHEHHSHNGLLDALNDCQALICRGMGRRLVDDLVAHAIAPLFCAESLVSEVAQRYASGELQPAQINQCSHHFGGSVSL